MGKKNKADGSKRGGRKRLAEVVASLEEARAKRDKAQSRVEALEALADELATQVAAEATTASEQRGSGEGAPGDDPGSTPRRKRRPAAAGAAVAKPRAAKPMAAKPRATKPRVAKARTAKPRATVTAAVGDPSPEPGSGAEG